MVSEERRPSNSTWFPKIRCIPTDWGAYKKLIQQAEAFKAPSTIREPLEMALNRLLSALAGSRALALSIVVDVFQRLLTACEIDGRMVHEAWSLRNFRYILQIIHSYANECNELVGQAAIRLLALLMSDNECAANTARAAGAIPPLVCSLRARRTYVADALIALSFLTEASAFASKVLKQSDAHCEAVRLAASTGSSYVAMQALRLPISMCKQSEQPVELLFQSCVPMECARWIGSMQRHQGVDYVRPFASLLSQIMQLAKPEEVVWKQADPMLEALASDVTWTLIEEEALPLVILSPDDEHCQCRKLLTYLEHRLHTFIDPCAKFESLKRLEQLASLGRTSHAVASKVAGELNSKEGTVVLRRLVQQNVSKIVVDVSSSYADFLKPIRTLSGLLAGAQLQEHRNSRPRRSTATVINVTTQKQLENHIYNGRLDQAFELAQALAYSLEPTVKEFVYLMHIFHSMPLPKNLLVMFVAFAREHMRICHARYGTHALCHQLVCWIAHAFKGFHCAYCQYEAYSMSRLLK